MKKNVNYPLIYTREYIWWRYSNYHLMKEFYHISHLLMQHSSHNHDTMSNMWLPLITLMMWIILIILSIFWGTVRSEKANTWMISVIYLTILICLLLSNNNIRLSIHYLLFLYFINLSSHCYSPCHMTTREFGNV